MEHNNAISILLVMTNPDSRAEDIDSTLDGNDCKAFVFILIHTVDKRSHRFAYHILTVAVISKL